jgi:PPOX class probable F420-dependent enzyme
VSKLDTTQIDEFLAAPRIAHVTTIEADGSPHTAPVWYEWKDGKFITFTPKSSHKLKNLQNDDRITISVASEDEPYRYVVGLGQATVSDDPFLDVSMSVASRYKGTGGREFIDDNFSVDNTPTLVTLVPDRLLTFLADD